MKYKKYLSYKDSGIDWLGEIPEHWEVKTLKYLIAKTIDNRGRTPVIEDTGIPMLEAKHINGTNTYNSNNFDKFISNESYKIFIRDDIEENDILFVTVGTIGKTNLVNKNPNFVIAQNIIAFRPNTDINSKFFLNYLRSQEIKEAMNATNKNSILDSIKISDFVQVRVSIPQIEEQQQIANFLDKATAKIDTLIEKQTKQIELLKEKRQAVISHAVTKGINPNVPMKDSGVEWLGEIPEHWEVVPLRYLGNLQNGISKGAEFFGLGFPFINYGDIYKNDSLPKDIKGLANTSFEDRRLYSVKRGDVFFTRTSETIDDIGIASTCLETISNATFSGFTIRFREFSINLFPEFSRYQFRSGYSQRFFEKEMNLVTRASLGQDLLKRLHVMIPPFQEQQQIVYYLDDKTSKIDTLIEKSKKSIELLKEKRTALISACVTGKIDVRELV